ncbi:ATP-dependent DNA ligase [Nocardiopsis nanhaiensis]
MVYEPKWDGFRCTARDGPVLMHSKARRPLHKRWPAIASGLGEQLPDGVPVDGGIIRWSEEGRLGFGALLRRNSAAPSRVRALARSEPCHYVVFDLLRVGDRDIAHRALSHRRRELEHLMARVVQP